jgi:hypothetical protein
MLRTVVPVLSSMFAKLHTSRLPQPPGLLLPLKAIILRHWCKLVDQIASSLLVLPPLNLPFNPKMVLPPLVLLVLIPLLRRKPEGSVITVATCLLNRVLKTQMILPRFCQILPSPQQKLDGVLSSSATRRIDLPFNPKMVLPLALLVLILLLRRKPEGSVITVATCLLDRVLKTQMLVLPRFCQVLPPPQR